MELSASMETQFRYAEFEYRQSASGPGIISGPAVVYGDIAMTKKGPERIDAGFFENLDSPEIRFNLQHERKSPLAANGRGLRLRDSATSLIAEITLPKTQAGYDAAEYVRQGVYTGLSTEFVPRITRRDALAGLMIQERGVMVGLALVDTPAFAKSTIEMRFTEQGELVAEWAELMEFRQMPISGEFAYNQPAVIAATGRKRKELVRPGAFDFVLNDPTREVVLTLGERADRPLASRLAGSLRLINSPDGLRFEIDQLPDTSYARDFEALLKAGTLAWGLRALYRKPPAEAVDGDVETEIPDDSADAEPGVTIGAINQALLTGLAIIPRAPRGNPGEVEQSPVKIEPTETERRALLRRKQELLSVMYVNAN